MFHQPGRLVFHEPADIAAPDQRNEIAEFVSVGVGQPAPVLVLLLGHLDEDLGGCREAFHEGIGEGRIGAGIVVLARDGEGEDFLFGQYPRIASMETSPHRPAGSGWPSA